MIMKKELYVEPKVIGQALSANEEQVKMIAKLVKDRGIKNITVIGRGTSDNAGLCFKYAVEVLTGIPVGNAHPSVTTMYNAKVNYENHLLIAISQSGKSTDTIAVLESAKESNALTVAVTNDTSSPLAQAAHFHLFLNAGEEIGVAATKTFCAELTVLYMLAAAIAGSDAVLNELSKIPHDVKKALGLEPQIHGFALKLLPYKNFLVLSRGIMQGVGKEAALKLNECCYNFSQFYSVTDFMHGPYALLEEGVNILLLAPSGECRDNYLDIATRAKLLGANVFVISDIPELLNIATSGVKMPKADFLTSTFTYSLTVHLFAYYLAIEMGLDPSAPRNLQKVIVTK